MSYTMQLYDDNEKAPRVGDLFQVTEVEANVQDLHWGRGTHIELEPCAGNEQLRAELAQVQQSNTACMQEAIVLHAHLADACATKELAQQGNLAITQENITLRTDLVAAVAARDALARERDSLDSKLTGERNELAQAHKYTARMVELVAERDRTIAHVRRELKDLHETDHKFGRLTILRNRDYWYDKAVAAECERDEWCKKAQAHLATLDAAEAALADARRVAGLWYRRAHGPWVEVEITGKEMVEVLRAERRERVEAEQRAARAEALAGPVTVEVAETLEALAIAGDLTAHPFTAELARNLAAQIREALDDNKT